MVRLKHESSRVRSNNTWVASQSRNLGDLTCVTHVRECIVQVSDDCVDLVHTITLTDEMTTLLYWQAV